LPAGLGGKLGENALWGLAGNPSGWLPREKAPPKKPSPGLSRAGLT